MHIIIDGIKSFLHIYTNKCLWSSSKDQSNQKWLFELTGPYTITLNSLDPPSINGILHLHNVFNDPINRLNFSTTSRTYVYVYPVQTPYRLVYFGRQTQAGGPVQLPAPDFNTQRSVVNPVNFFRIRFLKYRSGSGSGWPKKRPDPTGSESRSGSYLDMLMMFSKINIFYDIFLPNLNILWHLKSKIKNYYDI